MTYKVGDTIKLDPDAHAAIIEQAAILAGVDSTFMALLKQQGLARMRLRQVTRAMFPELDGFNVQFDFVNLTMLVESEKENDG